MKSVDAHTVAIGLRAKAEGASQLPLHGKLHVYWSTTSSTVEFDREAGPIDPNALPVNAHVRLVPPVLLQLSEQASEIKGMILETTPASGGCLMSTFLAAARRTGDIPADTSPEEPLTTVQNATRLVAPPATPISLECPVPFGYAHTIKAASLYTPTIAARNNISGMVMVLVSLRADGTVSDARIEKTASPLLNDAALTAATESTYAPEYVACVAVPAKYIFVVEFQG